LESAKVKNNRVVSVLRGGDLVIAVEGTHAGLVGLCLDPVAIADGLPHQRKVQVIFKGDTTPIHILPRQLELAEVPNNPTALGGTNAQHNDPHDNNQRLYAQGR
jgi:hypothetical protein